jgi:hypothetical protein
MRLVGRGKKGLRIAVLTILCLGLVPAVACRGGGTPEPTPASAPVSWAPDGVITPEEYPGEAHYQAYDIFWRLDGQYINIGLRAETGGWVAVGFRPQPLHRETDMVIGYVSGGQASVFDMFSNGELGPCEMDTELGGTNDILESGGSEAGGSTTIEFRRRLDTGDRYDGALTSGANPIIWAYSNVDDVRLQHIMSGRGELTLD